MAPTGVDNTAAASPRKSWHPRKDEYKHTRLPCKAGSASLQGRVRHCNAENMGSLQGVAVTGGVASSRQLGLGLGQSALSPPGGCWASPILNHPGVSDPSDGYSSKQALSTHKQLPRKEGIGCHNVANPKNTGILQGAANGR
ncbi:hypothetical protein F5890DRAFT_1477035 [Lentinula detonsa]|uniref:Uncharacterized protein n=1 Tax=Lentinula detonsa TaxID=2804962 RepID=A0AA38URE8_9AGAR|nr:hypothetical protein F5890DRAFT_1477035 [Lentinula detonsa]